MATYHLSLKNGKVGTAEQHADYILREGRYSGGVLTGTSALTAELIQSSK